MTGLSISDSHNIQVTARMETPKPVFCAYFPDTMEEAKEIRRKLLIDGWDAVEIYNNKTYRYEISRRTILHRLMKRYGRPTDNDRARKPEDSDNREDS